MSTRLNVPGLKEEELASRLREAVREQVERQGMDHSAIAESLEILPSTAENLLQVTSWSLEEAIRIAEALDVDIDSALRQEKNHLEP